MHRSTTGFFLIMALTWVVALTGCLGNSTSNPGQGGVRTVTLSPAGNLSIDVGSTQFFSATATDAQGRTVLGTINYIVSIPQGQTGPAPLSVTSAGNACAGTWDQTFSMCTPGTPGVAVVTAVVNGVSSVPTTVYVHFHVDSLQAKTFQTTPDPNSCYYQGQTCCSQGQTWIYQAVAYNNKQDITNTVGPVNWASTNAGVLTAKAYVPPNQPNVLNQVQITADSPGITNIFASVAGTTSNSLPVTSCLVQYIRLRASGSTTNSISVSNGGSVALQATVVDTAGFTMTKPPLTWSTSNPEVVSFSTLTNSTGTNNATARSNLGGAAVTASCTPPSCNIGVLPGMPVYASDGPLPPPSGQQGFGAISVNVTASKLPTYTAWAATDQCGTATGCASVMFPITPGTNPIGAVVTVPRTPNSMVFDYQTRIYLGSDQGLMYLDTGSGASAATLVSSATTPCNVSLCGKVLTISNDGKLVVVSDSVSATPQVYIYNGSNGAVTDLVLPEVATGAAFAPDQSKIFLLTNSGHMYVYSTVDALGVVSVPNVPSLADAAFSADGSFAYVAETAGGSGSLSAFSTCATPGVPSTELGIPVPTAAPPVQIFPSPNVQAITQGGFDLLSQDTFVLEPSPNTNPSVPPVISSVQILSAHFTQSPIGDGQFTCNPPNLYSFIANPTPTDLGQGNFTPVYARLVANGTEMIIVGRHIPAVLVFSVNDGKTSAIQLVNGGLDPLSASASSDGSQVYVAACDQYQPDGTTCAAGSVHIVDTTSRGDYQQVPYINNSTNNMCNGLGGSAPLCVADMVAIKPQ